ncbi:MAG: type II secretion system F family protein [Roseburia sp.]|nr:type II secretion system F family protein [Roseburia sp.]MCM1241654.1 type II secretion system F family protein [Roseburia sp.]
MSKNLKVRASSGAAVDYGEYVFDRKESVLYLLEGFLLVGIISYFFYQSIWAALFLSPVVVIFWKLKKKELAAKRRQELNIQFKDAVLAVSANQKAGYSIENAFREAGRDMQMLYGQGAPICRELSYIAKGLDNNVTLEKLLYDFGCRSHVPDILQFADVFLAAKRGGGNMTQIIAETADVIEQKISVDKEIQVLLSSKKMEQKIMNVIPFLIIFYISLTSKGFFDVLYHNVIGVVIMTICLLIYLAAFIISRKLVEIEV